MIAFESKGSGFSITIRSLKKISDGSIYDRLDAIAKQGVLALSAATPVDSGVTAASWTYKIERRGGSCKIGWYNTNQPNGKPIAIMLQVGHGTGTGGYVAGRDYINPAIKPVMERIKNEVRRAIRS